MGRNSKGMHRDGDTNDSTTRARGKVRNASKDTCYNSGDTTVLWSPIIVKGFLSYGAHQSLRHCTVATDELLNGCHPNPIRPLRYCLWSIYCRSRGIVQVGCILSLAVFGWAISLNLLDEASWPHIRRTYTPLYCTVAGRNMWGRVRVAQRVYLLPLVYGCLVLYYFRNMEDINGFIHSTATG